MPVKLFEHNEKTFTEVNMFMMNGQNCCVVNPCGSGKSAIMAKIIEKNPKKKIVILTKQGNARKYYMDKYKGLMKNGRIKIFTYTKMMRDVKNDNIEDYDADIYLVDEAHYIGAENWNIAFTTIVNAFDPLLVGFTATPQRFKDQGTDNTIVSEYFNNNSAGNFTTKDLQKDGLFIEPEYVLALYDLEREVMHKMEMLEDADISKNSKAYYEKKLHDALEHWYQNDCPEKIMPKINDYLYKKRGNKILVYTANVNELYAKEKVITGIIRKLYPGKKITSYDYHSKHCSALADFENDKTSFIKILYSIDKATETIHMDDLNIVIMLRPSISNRIITQQFGRINNVKNTRKSLILDMVGNFDNLNSVSFLGNSLASNRTESDKPNFNLKYVYHYDHIFKEIDKVTTKSKHITYNGYSSSVAKICEAFNKDYAYVKEQISKGVDPVIAISEAPEKTFKITETVMSGYYETKDFTLTDDQREYFDKATEITDSFIRNHVIKDEDMQQDLYLAAYEKLSTITDISKIKKYGLTTMISNHLSSRYMALQRIKYRHDKTIININDNATEVYSKMIHDYEMMSPEEEYVRNIALPEVMKKALTLITDRERKVIELLYGLNGENPHTLEGAGKRLGVTRERIRQIEAKACRKISHHDRICDMLNHMVDDYEINLWSINRQYERDMEQAELKYEQQTEYLRTIFPDHYKTKAEKEQEKYQERLAEKHRRDEEERVRQEEEQRKIDAQIIKLQPKPNNLPIKPTDSQLLIMSFNFRFRSNDLRCPLKYQINYKGASYYKRYRIFDWYRWPYRIECFYERYAQAIANIDRHSIEPDEGTKFAIDLEGKPDKYIQYNLATYFHVI